MEAVLKPWPLTDPSGFTQGLGAGVRGLGLASDVLSYMAATADSVRCGKSLREGRAENLSSNANLEAYLFEHFD